MFVLNGDITIGNKRFKSVNDIAIKKSIHEIKSSCIIKIPTSAVLKIAGKRGTESVQTAHQFKEGDLVNVQLGYNSVFKPEFKGFVKRVNLTTPTEIECEGYSWLLRNKKNIKRTWKTTTLIEVLTFVVDGTGIKLHPDIPDMPLKNLVVNNANGLQLIEYIVDLLKRTLTAFFIDDVLYVGLSYKDLAKRTVKYKLGWNTISHDNLKKREKEDLDVTIEFKIKNTDGTDSTASTQSNEKVKGIVKKDNLSAVTDSKWATEMAKAKLEQETYDGYEGDFMAFLVPYCQIGDRCEITSDRYPELNGAFFVDALEVTYGMSGARRKPNISLKLS